MCHCFFSYSGMKSKKKASSWIETSIQLALQSKGNTKSTNDYSLFINRSLNYIIIVALYVDYILVPRDDDLEIHSLKDYFHNRFQIQDLSHINLFLNYN